MFYDIFVNVQCGTHAVPLGIFFFFFFIQRTRSDKNLDDFPESFFTDSHINYIFVFFLVFFPKVYVSYGGDGASSLGSGSWFRERWRTLALQVLGKGRTAAAAGGLIRFLRSAVARSKWCGKVERSTQGRRRLINKDTERQICAHSRRVMSHECD